MHLGKIATFLGIFSFICILIVKYSQAMGGEINGPLVNLISSFLSSINEVQKPEKTYMEIKPLGFFDFFEDNLRFFLKGFAIVLATFSGIVAILASRRENNSLWYSAAISISCATLIEFSYIGAGIFALTCLVIIMNFRKWKLSKA